MDSLAWFLLLFVLLDVQGSWLGHLGHATGINTLHSETGQSNDIWQRPGRPVESSERNPGILRFPGRFQEVNSSVKASSSSSGSKTITSSSATTTTYFTRGGSAVLAPPDRFNNDLLPSFANTTATNVSVNRGKTVYLHCHVKHLGTKTVSWVRHRDIHVLTVGRITFTNDDRFEATNKPGSDVWVLRIRFPQVSDSGKYECQVSIKPPIARIVQLNVVEPQAIIPPGPELYVDQGSSLNITCLVPDSPEPPENIFWYHKDKMVSWDGSRQGVTITTEKGPSTTSNLFIPEVTALDSGIYVCAPQGMKEAQVRVRVLSGEQPQAIHTGSSCRCPVESSMLLMVLLSVYHALL